MTTLGKILVIINFVFAIVTGALIISVFTVRTNWKSSYDRLNRYYEVSQANVKTYYKEAELAKSEAAERVAQVNKEAKEKDLKITMLTDETEMLRKDKAASEEKARLAGVSTDAATQELLRLREESKGLRENVVKRDQRLLELEARSKDFQDKFVRSDISARSAHDRSERLLEQVQALTRELEKIRIGGSTTPTGAPVARKPPEDVKGVILDTDLKSGLVTISIGSDAGLSKGNLLEVYRLKPDARYLGQIRLLDVNFHESVGRAVNPQRAIMMQKGDTVASEIMSQR